MKPTWSTASIQSNGLRIALTLGEPAGIGPELVIKAAQRCFDAELVAIGDRDLLTQRAQQIGLPIRLSAFSRTHLLKTPKPGRLVVIPVPLSKPVRCGVVEAGNARSLLKALDIACRGCLENTFHAMVTGPIHKGVINDAGIPFTGHTEYLAGFTQTPHPVMMLATDSLRVALLTTHVPLSRVCSLITAEGLKRTVGVLVRELTRRFDIARPRIAVCGLNPHAGEGGHFGNEEETIIRPALEALRAEGIRVHGPLPADTAFLPQFLDQCDCVLTMYHDQGLPVLKHQDFNTAVNITLGLPIIRTSPDHGTALDLAGTGTADEESLCCAIQTAITMARAENRVSQRSHAESCSG
ncbi:MAG: 4-hydroxythreonine-4-phosphate dehydrogenase PdxA [Gammaproteobacteria bacterium]